MPKTNMIMPEDYKDVFYRLTYYILGKIAHRVPRCISPNAITLSAFFSAVIGCVLLMTVHSPAAYLYWALFNFIWYVLDALDGIHARLTNQSSEFGAFLDHFLDNLFFVVMFTAFVVKFQLLHPLYILSLLLRFTAATSVFLVQLSTQKLHLPKFSGGLEFVLLTSVMLLSYFFPNFNLANYFSNPTALSLIDHLALQSGFFMKLSLFVYLVGVPIHFILQLRFVHQHHLQLR